MNKPVIESVAKALVINSQNEVLVLTIGEHKLNPEKSYKPDLPGGLVDPGETEHDAVVREIMEETGIEIQYTQLEAVYSRTLFIPNENKSVTKHLFIARLDSNPSVKLSWEHADYAWVKLHDLKTTKLQSFYDEAVEYCVSNVILT